MSCNNKLAGMFARRCEHKPKQGLVKKWYLNWEDVDRTATQTKNLGTKVTTLVLKAGAKLYPAEGTDKSSKLDHAMGSNDFGNGYVHTDKFTVMYNGEEERQRIQEMVSGGRFVTIVKKVDTGINGELTYDIAGLESGMLVTEDVWNSSENSGTRQLTVATKEGEEELTGVKMFMMEDGSGDNDLAATEAWIEANEYTPA